MLFTTIRSLYILIKKTHTIVLSDNKINLFFNYILINSLKSMNSAKFDTHMILYGLFLYSFRVIIGVSYKFIKMSVVLFDCFKREYRWANIKKKRKNFKIIKKFIKNSFENFLFIEFIRVRPNTEKDIIISFKYLKRTIKIKSQTYKDGK